MSVKASITWSNSHQKRFEEMLSRAPKDGHLKVTSTTGFSLSKEFFHQQDAKDFVAHIPKELIDQMVMASIKQPQLQGPLGGTFSSEQIAFPDSPGRRFVRTGEFETTHLETQNA